MGEIVFTPAGLVELLSQIAELQNYDVGIVETIDGKLQLQVGDSVYELDGSANIPEVSAPEDVVDQVEEINLQAYDNLTDDFEVKQEVEGGLISSFVKALKLGGMLRLAAKVIPGTLK